MAEYAGYIGNQYPPTDWSKIGANLLGQIDQEKERRKVEKEKLTMTTQIHLLRLAITSKLRTKM